MYVSPINMISTGALIDNLIKDEIIRITQKYNLDINEEELIAALKADQKRYEEAWRFGYSAGLRKVNEYLLKRVLDGDTWINELYIEIRDRRNRLRSEGGNSDECRFLVHLMEEIEKNKGDSNSLLEEVTT